MVIKVGRRQVFTSEERSPFTLAIWLMAAGLLLIFSPLSGGFRPSRSRARIRIPGPCGSVGGAALIILGLSLRRVANSAGWRDPC